MASARKGLVAGLAAVVLVALAGYALVLGRRQTSWTRLVNGTEVRLAGVSYGTNQDIVIGWPWQKALHRILPAPLKARSGCRVYSFFNGDPGATFLLQERHLPLGKPDQESGLQIRYVDRYGCELMDNGGSTMTFSGENDGIRYTAL